MHSPSQDPFLDNIDFIGSSIEARLHTDIWKKGDSWSSTQDSKEDQIWRRYENLRTFNSPSLWEEDRTSIKR